MSMINVESTPWSGHTLFADRAAPFPKAPLILAQLTSQHDRRGRLWGGGCLGLPLIFLSPAFLSTRLVPRAAAHPWPLSPPSHLPMLPARTLAARTAFMRSRSRRVIGATGGRSAQTAREQTPAILSWESPTRCASQQTQTYERGADIPFCTHGRMLPLLLLPTLLHAPLSET